MKQRPAIIDLKLPITQAGKAVDLLATASGLAKARLKEAMAKGAVWLRPGRGKARRLRRGSAEVRPGDLLHLCYDDKILNAPVPEPACLADHRTFSVWFKPAGLLSQGTDFGDFSSLLRQVELHFNQQRPVFLIHRLDREACGLVVIAHDKQTAARLSSSFAERRVTKSYLAGVRGRIEPGACLRLDAELDNKPACTRCQGLRHDAEQNESLVLAQPETGRLHQIRRHLAGHHTPIIGDPRYGGGPGELRLCAVGLQLPAQGKNATLELRLPAQYLPEWAQGAAAELSEL